uniref:AlNc14C499G11938 protein n=1 Tax=Albugo laibachii Nc14 TaxID=890382 RepID=F0X0J3_9STRA|nr:AlNc14C499G11938 [Albugo laibachii Nc14]|eukprot:CCA27284.1 AlNc14C499G11938 [Albugo laibachii Nc14]
MVVADNPRNQALKRVSSATNRNVALAAGGVILAVYFVSQQRNKNHIPAEDINDSVLRPGTGTVQQVGTNRYQQQHRTPPPSKKNTLEKP